MRLINNLMKYAEVAVSPPVGGQGLFSYSIPPHMEVQAGHAVRVPFGKKIVLGLVVQLTETPQVESTKDIISLAAHQPLLTPEQLNLTSWISQHYLCSYFHSGALMLPPGFPKKLSIEIESVSDAPYPSSLSQELLALLLRLKMKKRTNQSDLEKEMGKRRAALLLSRLESEGLIKRYVQLGKEGARPKVKGLIVLELSRGDAIRKAEELNSSKYKRQAVLLKAMADYDGLLTRTQAKALLGGNYSAIKSLVKKGWVREEEQQVWRDPLARVQAAPSITVTLTSAQREACEKICQALEEKARERKSSEPDVFLLHGVTGSGKTEVYLESLSRALSLGRRGLVLVPEIALTPQTVERFMARFPGQVAVMHSRLSLGERYDEWRRIKDGGFGVVIGSRSAIYAPQPDLGLIVIDEEHEWSYKNQDMPRYHARDVALELARFSGAIAVLGSATPDLESYYYALRGKYHLLRLPGRITPLGEAPLPQVQLVDMREEHKAGNHGLFSRALLKALEEVLIKEEQAILYLNRRGTSTLVLCRACGYVFRCRRCFVALTYHAQGDFLLCHQCNFKYRSPTQCPRCGGFNIRFRGSGTEGLESEVLKVFPGVRSLRWDSDTVRRRGSHEDLLARFRSHQADILIGTQMIAKGLDLPLVTLVGIVLADLGLNLPHFKAGERVFQLLCQAAGRAGRGIREGKVIVQSYNPQHYAIRLASEQDYQSFYERELAFRRQYGYPPFTRLINLTYSYSNQSKCQVETGRLKGELEAEIDRKGLRNMAIIGPSPSFPEKLRGRYHWHLLIKGEDPSLLLKDMRLGKGWAVDVDPIASI